MPAESRDVAEDHAPRESAAAAPDRILEAPYVERVLALQRSAGNAAVARMADRLRPPPLTPGRQRRLSRDYADPGVKEAYEANKTTVTATQTSALGLLDNQYALITGPWKKLDWAKISKSAADRVVHPEHIQQNPLGLCGPASLLNYMAESTPGTYAYDVVSIFEDGKWGSKKINSTLLGNEPRAGMDPCDWMMMSAIQDLSNDVLDYYGTETKVRDGQTDGDLRSSLTSFTKVQKTTHYSCGYWGVKTQTDKVSDLLSKYGNDVVVIMDVDSTTLQGEDTRGSNDHFIRLRKPVTWTADDKVKFDVFTWGSYRSLTFKKKNFEHMVDGYVVGAVRGDIDL
jgi:hypothetical protein